MQNDERCCGTGTCILDAQGLCWCGQRWDGMKMCLPTLDRFVALEAAERVQPSEKANPQ